MHQIGVKGLSIGIAAVLLSGMSLDFASRKALALETCEPPQAGEYLVLIVSETPKDQDVARRTLPGDIKSQICQYVDGVVTRIGGFEDQLVAEDWASFIQNGSGLQTYVIKPETTQRPRTTTPVVRRPPASQPNPRPRQTADSRFDPKPLGSGYAVLVDYLNQPELATQVKQVTQADVGLVSYGQRPYLLVQHTSDLEAANSILKTLSNRGFFSLMVDSRRVTVITPKVTP